MPPRRSPAPGGHVTYPPDRRSLRPVVEGLALFREVLDDQIGRAARTLVEEPNNTPAARLLALLTDEAELYPEELVGDAWQNHLLDRLLTAENAFSKKAERASFADMGPGLQAEARRELALLHQLYRDGANVLAKEAYSAIGEVSRRDWGGLKALGSGPAVHTPEAIALKQAFAESTDWASLAERLAESYAASGVGNFGRFRAFRWVRGRENGHLEGVAYPDLIRLSDLIGYEQEREPAVRNAERFVAGLPANNVLLYGERGTGKSSTVKALLNELGDRGLRLIEVSKEHLDDFPEILAPLRHRRQRFLLYVDDLSFEEQETYYKALKAVLEGGVEARPENVLLYATSNRRHIIREHFGDRALADDDDDVHAMDTMEEKLSLSDRFGIRIRFGTPDQARYLDIVRGLASKRGVTLSDKELTDRALAWVQRQNGRSGRTARQFIDALIGELAMP
jgi:predicted AAA+ superfamily ATPase